VDRAARDTRRKVARFGPVALLLAACATIQDPPGGPPDFDAPIIVSITPDSGAVVAGLENALDVRFNEVIDERSGSGLENLVILSPRPEELDVSWKRTRFTVKPKGGWRENVIYHLSLLPGIQDLRSNRLDSGRTIVFSTGGEIPDTRIGGTAIDWDAGRAAERALIEAVLMPDSLVYVVTADSVGDFEIRHLTPGSYLLSATVDQNNNGIRDYREFFDSATVRLDSSVSHVLWAFAHDTVGPRITELSDVDSITIKIDFSQKLVTAEPHDSVVQVYAMPDTTLIETVAVWNQVTYDSVRTVEAVEDSIRQAAVADSIRAAEAAADSAAAAADTIGVAAEDTAGAAVADTTAAEGAAAAEVAEVVDSLSEELLQVVDSADQVMADSVPADTSQAELLLLERPQLSISWYVRLAVGLVPGARYLVSAVAENLTGAVAESQGLLIIPEPVDTTQVSADTT
jgi:hypothetical protein